MYKGIDTEDVILFGCANGINWDVIHNQDNVLLKFENGLTYTFTTDQWISAVCSFSDQVEMFYKISDPKKPYDSDEEDGYTTFQNEWKRRRQKYNPLISIPSPIMDR
jgi:hypothetical protein